MIVKNDRNPAVGKSRAFQKFQKKPDCVWIVLKLNFIKISGCLACTHGQKVFSPNQLKF